MARYFYSCPNCGANLDPGEKCCCEDSDSDSEKETEKNAEKEDARTSAPVIFKLPQNAIELT